MLVFGIVMSGCLRILVDLRLQNERNCRREMKHGRENSGESSGQQSGEYQRSKQVHRGDLSVAGKTERVADIVRRVMHRGHAGETDACN
jgi:hypothetical protein